MAGIYCSRCGKVKDGAHKAYCKACQAAYVKAKRTATPEARAEHNAYQKEWRAQNPEKQPQYRRASHLKNLYGLTIEEFNSMLEDQANLCLVCDKEMDREKKRGKNAVAVDHDHETGDFRGLICASCNSGIGYFQDNPDILVAAAAYLVRHEMKKEAANKMKDNK